MFRSTRTFIRYPHEFDVPPKRCAHDNRSARQLTMKFTYLSERRSPMSMGGMMFIFGAFQELQIGLMHQLADLIKPPPMNLILQHHVR